MFSLVCNYLLASLKGGHVESGLAVPDWPAWPNALGKWSRLFRLRGAGMLSLSLIQVNHQPHLPEPVKADRAAVQKHQLPDSMVSCPPPPLRLHPRKQNMMEWVGQTAPIRSLSDKECYAERDLAQKRSSSQSVVGAHVGACCWDLRVLD